MKRAGITFFAMIMALGTLAVGPARASDGRSRSALAECNQPPPPPMPPASDFVARRQQILPTRAWNGLRLRGTEEGDRVLDKVVVTDMTKTILGVRATVVLDSVELNGQPSEKTLDWYAQDKHRNVWYMGEAAFEYVHGHWIRAADSWQAGRHGARPGIIMEAHSKVGDTYRQEFFSGHAEDTATVLSRHATISVPYGSFRHALKTNECTPLEPGVLDVKYYAKGVGEVFEATVRAGQPSSRSSRSEAHDSLAHRFRTPSLRRDGNERPRGCSTRRKQGSIVPPRPLPRTPLRARLSDDAPGWNACK